MKRVFKRKVRFTYCAILILLSGCSFQNSKEKNGSGTGGGTGNSKGDSRGDGTAKSTQGQSLGFTNVSGIVADRCVTCHNPGDPKGGVDLSSYELIRRNYTKVKDSVVNKTMPKDTSLSEDQFQTMISWLNAGAPKEPGESGSGSNRGPVTWAMVNETIVQKKCLECHSQPNPEGKLDFTDAKVVRDNIGKIFDRVVITQICPMPPVEKLTTQERKDLSDWIVEGMAE